MKRERIMWAGGAIALAALLALAARGGALEATLAAARSVGPAILALSLLATMVSMLINGLVWARVLRCLGCHAPLRLGLAVYAGSGLASYVGSGAGAAGQCALLLRPHGLGARRAVLLLALASLVGFCGSMIWAPCGVLLLATPAAAHAVPLLGAHGPLLLMAMAGVCGIGALLVLVAMILLPRRNVPRPIARLFGDALHAGHRIPLRRMLALIPYTALAWLVGAGPLWLLVRAAMPATALTLPAAIGIQSVATIAGCLTFFLPNGLGARDGAIIGLLVGVAGVSLPVAAAAATLLRASDPVAKVLIVTALAAGRRMRPPSVVHSLPKPARSTGQRLGRELPAR